MSALMPWQSALQKVKVATASTSTPTPIPHHSKLWPARMENPPPVCLPDTLDTYQPGPPVDRLSIFSDLNAVKAHMHVQHKLGPKSKQISNHQSTTCYTIYQELIKQGIFEKDISNSFENMQVSPLEKRKMSCFTAQIGHTTKSVPLSATIQQKAHR